METRTTTLLLEGLHDTSNTSAWREFDERYTPIIIAFSRSLGLGHDEACDAAQEAMVRFLNEYRAGRYDRSKGRLRSFLISIVRYRALDILRARAPHAAVTSVPEELDEMWGQAQRHAIFDAALAELRSSSSLEPRTIEAFELQVRRGMAPEVVAEQVGMTVDSVYMAKRRVVDRLRPIVERLEALYDD